MNDIRPGYTIKIKESNYEDIEQIIKKHNDSAQAGEHYWGISFVDGSYTIYEANIIPKPKIDRTIDEDGNVVENPDLELGYIIYDKDNDVKQYILYTKEELAQQINDLKERKIEESKNSLKEYLAAHPMEWLDGKYYSVTSEKQSLLTSNLALYQVASATSQPFKLTWNSTGDECTEWTYENLCALALAIGSYVKPFVSKQQEIEIAVKEAENKKAVEAIEIKYE